MQQTLPNTLGGDDGLSDDLAIELPMSVTLPSADLGNLAEIETSMRVVGSSANGRDALAKFIMTDGYISKLIPLVEMAEDLESLPDLHRLCNIMKTIILLNDTAIIEHAVSDECVMGVVGALEYDPDFPSHKANHRHWLGNKGRYKEVVEIDDSQTIQKIHQTYRLQYLKDVVLARILDDPTFSVLNSLIFFNQVDILQHLQANSGFLSDLFAIFNAHRRDQGKKKEAVLFIQQCCAVAKSIQPPARQALYNNLVAHGLLQVIHFGLRHEDVGVRVGATDIMISFIDHDPQMIRQTIYRQMHDNQPTLIDSLTELLLVEVDLGVKSQITEALKVLLDQGVLPPGAEFVRINGEYPGRPRPQQPADPQQELFLTRFYERSAPKLFAPLLQLEHRTDLTFGEQQASLFTYLVDVLSFFVRQHHRFSRLFIMTNDVVKRVSQLLGSTEKYLRLGERNAELTSCYILSPLLARQASQLTRLLCCKLVAIRFFRGLISMQEDFYVKQLIEQHALSPALDVLIETMPRDNLLSSACLELFEFIRKEGVKDLIKYLVGNRRESIASLSYMPTFREILMRYDQTAGYTANMDYYLDGEDEITRRPPANSRLMEQLPVDPNEEEYWNTSDPEDDDDHTLPEISPRILPSNGPLPISRPLVDYPSDEDSDENAAAEEPNTASEAPPAETDAAPAPSVVAPAPTPAPADDDAAAAAANATAAPAAAASAPLTETKNSLPTVAPPVERLSEKRRREEDEEDELGKLSRNKRRNSAPSEASAASSSSSRTASTMTTSKQRKSYGGSPSTSSSSNGKIAINLSPAAVRTVGGASSRSDEES